MTSQKKFLAADKSWRLRSDLMENTKRKESTEQYCAFSAYMARKYALLYLVIFYFGQKQENAWINDVLSFFGWNGLIEERNKELKKLNRVIASLRKDFNLEIELVSASKEERKKGKGYFRYLKVTDYGIFEKKQLLTILLNNKDIFINIIENNGLSVLF